MAGDVLTFTPVHAPLAGGQKPFDPRGSSLIAGTPDDAKWYRYPFNIPAGGSLIIDPCVGAAWFMDTGTVNVGTLFITADTCFGEMAITAGAFVATRPFRKLTLRNGGINADGVGSICVSINPRFLVIQGVG